MPDVPENAEMPKSGTGTPQPAAEKQPTAAGTPQPATGTPEPDAERRARLVTGEFKGGPSATGAVKWETEYCPVCKARTTFYYLTDTRLCCMGCKYEIDRMRGLDLNSDIFK